MVRVQPAHHRDSLREGGRRKRRLARKLPRHVAQEPRLGKRVAPDHDRRRAGPVEHLPRRGQREDVAVGDHRDAHGLDDLSDAVEVHRPRKPLRAGASVHRQRGRPRGLQAPGQVHGGIRRVPAQPDLDRDGNRHGLHDPARDLDGEVRRLHERGAGAPAADLFLRAAHVDVDQLRAARREPLRGLGEEAGLRAVDLPAKRAVVRRGGDQPRHLPAAAAQDAVRVDHLAEGQPDAAERPDQPPERQVRVARHRREDDARLQFQVAQGPVSNVWKSHAPIFPMFGKYALFFSNVWKNLFRASSAPSVSSVVQS